ncbi:hypothetical protein HY495_00005, partial [Candidatus Woesearchaeota archaeon]|nr:hypothetical protein [Candidatus Woesearchaeota archaeon]
TKKSTKNSIQLPYNIRKNIFPQTAYSFNDKRTIYLGNIFYFNTTIIQQPTILQTIFFQENSIIVFGDI